MKILKQMISFALCLALVCSLVPGLRVSASGLEAYNLTWGIALEYGEDGGEIEVARPGAFSFCGTSGQDYMVETYRVGQETVPVSFGVAYLRDHNRISNSFLAIADLESGEYYFVVTPVTPDQATPMGSSVTSPVWTYIRPDAKMPTPGELRWNWPYGEFSPIEPVAGETIIEGEYLFAKELEDTPISIGGFNHWDTGRASQMEMDGGFVQDHGPGYYFFRVRALSPNVELYCHGDWSEMSSPYYCESGSIEYPPEEEPAPDRGDSPFVDVFVGDYFYDPVLWAVERGVTTGMDAEHFAPGEICTRGQIVTFLWRACGSPEPQTESNPFRDVSDSDYFYKAVLWAVETGVTTGMGEGLFAPEAPCTRGQVATFLWRSKGEPANSGSNSTADRLAELDTEYQQKKASFEGYYDAEISLNEATLSDLMEEADIFYLNDKAYYQTEIYELQQEIISLNNKYHYTTSAVEQSRIQKEIAALQEEVLRLNLCVNACDAQEAIESLKAEKRSTLASLDSWYTEEKQKIEESGTTSAPADNPFFDVAADAYYFEPVLWAVENGITNGMGDGSFAPDAPCTRGQIVTFLHRASGIASAEPQPPSAAERLTLPELPSHHTYVDMTGDTIYQSGDFTIHEVTYSCKNSLNGGGRINLTVNLYGTFGYVYKDGGTMEVKCTVTNGTATYHEEFWFHNAYDDASFSESLTFYDIEDGNYTLTLTSISE